MSAQEAQAYHQKQVETFAGSAADMVCVITINYVEEAVGIAQAAQHADMPVALSFTVETDGRLPTGQPLKEAIEQVDEATSTYPCYYIINCAIPHISKGCWLRVNRGWRESEGCGRTPRA